MIVFGSTADLTQHVGTHLGSSPWVTLDHQHIRGFGEATHDFNWIHFDTERAAASRSDRSSRTATTRWR